MSTVIALAALLFTAATFWWLNARRGRLVCSVPRTFAAYDRPDAGLLRLPLVLYNTGARALVVEDLRLRVGGLSENPWRWTTTRATVRPEAEDVKDFAAAFPIGGRAAIQLIAEFRRPDGQVQPLAGVDHDVELDVRMSHQDRWKRLREFALTGSGIEHPGNYITYRNGAE